MKRNLDVTMLMPDMKTVMTAGESRAPLTAGLLISEAAIGMYSQEDPQPDQKEKALRFEIGVRCGLGGDQVFKQSEMDCILRVADLKCGTWLFGQLKAWAEGVDPFAEAAIKSSDPLDVSDAHIDETPTEQAA